MELVGARIVVTGASRGIGARLATRRDLLVPLLAEAPRRMTEFLLTGVRAQ